MKHNEKIGDKNKSRRDVKNNKERKTFKVQSKQKRKDLGTPRKDPTNVL